jgi:hypothetical protein
MILKLGLVLSPNKLESASAMDELSPLPSRATATCGTKAQGGYFKSLTMPETAQFMKTFPLTQHHFLPNPLIYPKSEVLLSHIDLQLNDLSPPAARGLNPPPPKDIPKRLLAKAGNYLKTPYRQGASLQTGSATDCSGFVQYIYKKFDVHLPRSSSEQARVGKIAARKMDFAKLIPADLLFFSRGGRHIGHVGIYMGEGKMIHAADPRHGVTISNLRQPYFESSFVVAKRVLTDSYHQ